MKVHELTAIGLRIFAIVLFLYTLRQFVGVASYLGNASDEFPTASGYYLSATILVPFIVAVLVWLFPLSLAKSIVPNMEHQPLVALSQSELYIAAITLLGIYVLSYAVPDFIFWLTRFYIASTMRKEGIEFERGSEPTSHFVSTIVELAIGVWLVLGSKGILRVIKKTRDWQ